jgi:hypothetical protein
VRTKLRLATTTLYAAIATAPAMAIAATYDATGAMVEEHELSAYEKVTSYISTTDIIVIVIAFMLPGMPMSLFWAFAALALYGGYKFAICAMFGYCLLDYCIGGPIFQD